jgi:hypothetical protein
MNELYGIPELPDLDDLDYMSDTVTPLQAKAEEVSQSFGFTEQLMMDFLHRLYDGKLDAKLEVDASMWEQVRSVLREAVAKGYDEPNMPDADEVFYEQLQHNTDVFAAFKVHRMQNDMAHMLLDSNGKLKTFEQWSNDVQTIASHQVGKWLQTEYDTAVIRAHQAADWQQFEREKDVLPNLKWMPSTSAHPGADHRVFWGTVRPINDPFWSSHRPGDRWNCKCSLSSTDEPITQIPDATPSDGPQNGLENNPGTDAKAFSDSHPYFPANCASCDFYKGSKEGFTNRVKNCYNCPYTNGCISRSVKQSPEKKGETVAKLSGSQRYKVRKDMEKWANENLPAVRMPDGAIAYRMTKTLKNGDELIIGKKFFTETYSNNKKSKNLIEIVEALKHVEEWIGSATHNGVIEPGRHHLFDFKVYLAEYKNYKIQLKAAMTAGLHAYTMEMFKK